MQNGKIKLCQVVSELVFHLIDIMGEGVHMYVLSVLLMVLQKSFRLQFKGPEWTSETNSDCSVKWTGLKLIYLILEIVKVRSVLFQNNSRPLELPSPTGKNVTLSKKVFVPQKDYPDVSFQTQHRCRKTGKFCFST